MNINKNTINSYDQESSLILISPFPQKNQTYSNRIGGLSSFGKNLVSAMQKNEPDKKIIVISDVLKNKRVDIDENCLIIRTTKREKLWSLFQIFRTVNQFTKVKNVLFQFDFTLYGGLFITSFIPLILLFMRLRNKNIFFIMHLVETDLRKLQGHFGWSKNSIRLNIFNILLKSYYIIISLISSKIIVLEDEFKKRLVSIKIPESKIIVIPHGVDSNLSLVQKQKAKKILNINNDKKVVLYFGLISWYKGVDWFIEQAIKNPDILFIVAGGKAITQSGRDHYENFFNKILKKAENIKNLRLTGFVKENKISTYFASADTIVLPYRTMISSSGPLSLAFSFEKPVLLSTNLFPYMESKEFSKALKTAGLKIDDVFFDLNENNFTQKIQNLKNNQLEHFSRLMKTERDYKLIGQKYLMLLEDYLPNYSSNLKVLQPIMASR